ncbi:MAG TPA: methanol oxidation system protein MoxJ [Ideonella sp.]|nr:methanol oxidation system protein MoxJ [Ideonella sp.]
MKTSLTAVALATLLLGAHAGAAETLRVCAADNDLPYSTATGAGFEDRLAAQLGAALGMAVERVAFADPRYIVRDGIDKGTCDVMLGVDSSDPRLQTTSPYYRSSYVFLTRAKDRLELRDWNSEVLKTARLGVIPGTPAETMLRQIGRHSESFSYLMSLGGNKSMRNRFVRYDVEKLVNDLAEGRIDVAVAWAPAVARYVKASKEPLHAVVVPEARRSDGERVVFSYDTSIGIKKGNALLLSRIENAMAKLEPVFDQVLVGEGIASLTPQTAPMAAAAGVPRQ